MWVKGDKYRIIQVISNLLGNTLKFAKGGRFISKGIVEAHGDKMWAENNADGRGAALSFSLPIAN